MKKYGSDPSGSRVNNLERGEAENRIKSIVFNDEEQNEVQEYMDGMSRPTDRDWTPLFNTTSKHPPQPKSRSDQSE